MAKQVITLHVYAGTQWNEGNHVVANCDYRDIASCMTDKIWLFQQDVEFDIPDIDLTGAKIEALEAQVQIERDKSERKVRDLLEQIGKLRCLEHRE